MLTCSICGYKFKQDFNPRKKPKPETEVGEERKTMEAAKVNGQGPFCDLCRYLEMALRHAQLRQLNIVAEHIERAQEWTSK